MAFTHTDYVVVATSPAVIGRPAIVRIAFYANNEQDAIARAAEMDRQSVEWAEGSAETLSGMTRYHASRYDSLPASAR